MHERQHDGITYQVRKYGAAGNFYVFWTEGRRSQRASTGTKDFSEAVVFLNEMIDGLSRGEDPTIEDLWIRRYGPGSTLAASTLERSTFAWKVLGPVFGGLRPRQIDQRMLDEYLKKRRAGAIGRGAKSSSTLRLEVSLLQAVITQGIKDRTLDVATLSPLHTPAPAPARVRWLSDDEISRMKTAAKEMREARGEVKLSREEAWLEIALATGARKQAILDLTWARVNKEARLLTLLPDGKTQTRKKRPTVRFPDSLLPILDRLKIESTSDLVVPAGNGKLGAALDRIAAKAEVENFYPHVTRHTVATKLVRAGIPLFDVSKYLGTTVEMIEKVYGHWAPDHGAAAAAVLG